MCTEIIEAWPAPPDQAVSCDDGNSHYLYREGLSACGSQTTSCSARVGEWRACMLALAGAPCEATPEPEQCTALRSARGCEGLLLPVFSQCSPPTPEQLAAVAGIYHFVDRSSNSLNCDAEGAPLPAQGWFALTTELIGAVPYSPLGETRLLVPLECGSIEACRELAAELANGSDPYAPSPASANTTLLDSVLCGPDRSGALHTSFVSRSDGEDCRLTRRDQLLLPQPDGSLRVELRSFELPPAEGELCYFSDAVQSTCVSFDVLHAERVAPL